MTSLQIRLKNCINTIVDLQADMRKFYRASFAEDFWRLKSYAAQVGNMSLNEEDVSRLELLTSDFVREIGFTLKQGAVTARQTH